MTITKKMRISDLLKGCKKRTSRTKIADDTYLIRTIETSSETDVSCVLIGYETPILSSLQSLAYFYNNRCICYMDVVSNVYTVYDNNIYANIFIDEIKGYDNEITLRIVGDNMAE